MSHALRRCSPIICDKSPYIGNCMISRNCFLLLNLRSEFSNPNVFSNFKFVCEKKHILMLIIIDPYEKSTRTKYLCSFSVIIWIITKRSKQ